jgi:indolepyruvate decarboxylase
MTNDSAVTTIGQFLIRRPKEAGIDHALGVPGDFNLELMQQIEDGNDLEWIGTCNELNASYAADGYARVNGIAALIVTNGVGWHSARSTVLPAPTVNTFPSCAFAGRSRWWPKSTPA